MGRVSQRISPSEAMPTTIFLACSGLAGTTKEYTFTNSSIVYFENVIANSFDYLMLDNLGSGLIRISYNRPSLDITSYTNGAKTLKSGDSLYLEESIWFLKILFIEDSTVELIMKSGKET